MVYADEAILSICANWSGASGAMETTRVTVYKGCGTVRFIFTMTPKNYGDESPFWIISKLNKADNYFLLYNTPHLNLDVNK